MAFLTTTELADMRTHATATLPDVCAIDYRTELADGMGGYTETWTSRGTAIGCRLAPAMRGRYRGIPVAGFQGGNQVKEGQDYNLWLAYGQALAVEDRVTVSGTVYRVVTVNTNESELLLRQAELVLWE